MNDKLQFIPLKEISTIHKGLSVKSKIWKNTLRDEIEKQYGVQKNDIVISRKIYSTGKKMAVLSISLLKRYFYSLKYLLKKINSVSPMI